MTLFGGPDFGVNEAREAQACVGLVETSEGAKQACCLNLCLFGLLWAHLSPRLCE